MSIYGLQPAREASLPETRSFDGSGNNMGNPTWGQAGRPLLRSTTVGYADGLAKPRRGPNARKISNAVCQESAPRPAPHPRLSSFVWAWGQFVDHEIDLTPEQEGEGGETISLKAPANDPVAPKASIHFARSQFVSTGEGPRQQLNALSAYIDAANVYGPSLARALALRELDGTGRLKVSSGKFGDLLPHNERGLPNGQGPLRASEPSKKFFLAGDVRSNEHAVLLSLHTLFVREHNRLCKELAARPDGRLVREIRALGRDEAIFQRSRRHVIALEQAITYNEFLPAILGPKALSRSSRYDPTINAGIANVFSTAAYRLGHDMLNTTLALESPFGDSLRPISLDRAFWKPELIRRRGIDVFLGGLATMRMESINCQTVEDVRSRLFNVHPADPGMLLDLAALNITRGRDHGLPDYNQCRKDFGLRKHRRFEDITSDVDRQARLRRAYRSVDDIDPWIGGLCEDPHDKSIVGELFCAILCDQFTRLRDGDRFWFERDPGLSHAEVRHLRKTRLADVIKRNTLISQIQDDVFTV